MPSDEPQYQVGLSFAGEQRYYVSQVASELEKRGVRTFYDEREMVNLWGKDQYEELHRVYSRDSTFVVMFISSEYASKAWPTHERRAAFEGVIRAGRDRILPVRFDDAEVPGLNANVIYLQAGEHTPEQLAEAICKHLVREGGRIEPSVPEFRALPPPENQAENCAITVTDRRGDPIPQAHVLFVASNGTTTAAHTDEHGRATMAVSVRRQVAVFVAHEGAPGAYYPEHDNHVDLEVTLPHGDGRGSTIFDRSTGHITGFRPRLNPIGNNLDAKGVPTRTYLYISNGSADGSPEQPYHFKVGTPMLLEDNEGYQVRATCVAFVGSSTLWEYEVPRRS